MFGCIGRLVVLGVVLAAGIAAYATRDRWMPATFSRMMSRRNVTVVRWEPVTSAGAARAQAAVDSLRRPSGPAFVNVAAADVVALVLKPVLDRLAPASGGGTDVEARSEYGTLMLRGSVKMSDLGGAAALGPLAGVLEGTQRIELRGRVEVPAPGKATFEATQLKLGELSIPQAAIGRIIRQLAPAGDTTLAEAAVALPLPPSVADVRVRPAQVTLYKGAP